MDVTDDTTQPVRGESTLQSQSSRAVALGATGPMKTATAGGLIELLAEDVIVAPTKLGLESPSGNKRGQVRGTNVDLIELSQMKILLPTQTLPAKRTSN